MYVFFSDKPDSVEYDHLSGPTITCELERHLTAAQQRKSKFPIPNFQDISLEIRY